MADDPEQDAVKGEDEGANLDLRAGARLMRSATLAQRRTLIAGVTVGLTYASFKIAVPIALRDTIDKGFGAGDPEVAKGAAWLLGLLVGLSLFQAAAGGVRRYLAMRLALRVQTDLRQQLFERWQRLSFGYHDRAQTGQLMARANSDLEQMQNFIVYMPLMCANALTFAGALAFMFWIDWSLALLALGVLPLLWIVAHGLSKQISPVMARLQQRLSDLTSVVQESIAGIRVVKAHGREPEQVRQLTAKASDVLDESLVAAKLRAVYLPAMIIVPSVATLVVIWYGGRQAIAGRVTIGDLMSFVFFINMLVWPLQLVGELMAQWRRSVVSAARVDEVLSTTPVIANLPGARAFPRGGGEVCFEGVTFSYGSELPVLEDLSFTVPAGRSVAVVGPTGCGKSTVARLIPRFYETGEGRVLVDGSDVRDFTLRSLRDRIAIVFEDTFLFSDTIWGNIAYGNLEASDDEIIRAAELASAHGFITELPDGYDTVIGEEGMTLSGGQRQRIAIARALLRDPEILILDSATTSVDAAVESEIQDALETVMEGRTTLIVTDRPAAVALADTVLYLERGRLVAEGSHADLMDSVPRYARLMSQGVSERFGRAS